jgi:hypothetical protein
MISLANVSEQLKSFCVPKYESVEILLHTLESKAFNKHGTRNIDSQKYIHILISNLVIGTKEFKGFIVYLTGGDEASPT